MIPKNFTSLAVGIVLACSAAGASFAAERPTNAPSFDLSVPGTDAGHTLPGPKFCPAGDDKCVKDFILACESAGGYWTAVSNPGGGDAMSCSSQAPQ